MAPANTDIEYTPSQVWGGGGGPPASEDNDYKDKEADIAGADADADVTTPPSSYAESLADERTGLHRALKARHLSMIAVGGVIGPGWFYSIGTGFTYGGPGGVIIGFGTVGVLLYLIMQSLGELAAFISVTGSFTDYTARFLDPALAFALGWVYVVLWGGFLINEYYVLGLICTYWQSKLPWWGFVLAGWVFFYLFGCIGVRGYGEAEFFLTWLKLLFIISFFLCSVLITTGAIGDGGHVGFKYWRDPGGFSDGVRGVFKCFSLAAIFYAGAEMIGLTAGEAQNPGRDIPRAVRLVFIRIFVVYIGSLFFLSLVIAWNDPNLFNGTQTQATSPYILAFTNVGLMQAGNVLNAFILTTVFSAINGALYVSSRCLVSMSRDGYAPKIFGATNRYGAPYVAVAFCNAFGLLALLNLSDGAVVVYNWMVSIGGVSTFITWTSIVACHIRFRKALKLQGISVDELPYRAAFFPYAAYVAFAGGFFLIFFQGWTVFLPPFDVQTFLMNYIMIPIFVLLALGYKLIRKTKWVDLATADLVTGRRPYRNASYEKEGVAKRLWANTFG
ncbi:General amino acid permease AGP3 [Vanrija pseudolonga]|uniref:General amino acid permease AGP3 n=1 Tax=Vanrija pseudolonga TaxID=143232 RepID=A0AAF0YB87_9TREE|nr:General amino acid permease AGP3 [Vanrija pseudolonga]WOO83288.1 General amino acid permease AGP3 [Vanrija pseudolonga]